MKKILKRMWWLPLLGGIIYFAGYLVVLKLAEKSVPPEFSEARINGARLAEEIVATSAYSSQNLEKISRYDAQGDFSEALILISQEVVKNRDVREKAIQLSSELEHMAVLIPDIKPAAAREIATEALTSEIALVSHLISYNDLFSRLFELLRDKFEGRRSGNPDGEVTSFIIKINEEARAINDFNSKSSTALAEFDKIFSSK